MIDSLVEINKDKNFANYNRYTIMFYKKSNETNVKNILANPRVIYRYSQDNDWIYKYGWNSGKSTPRWKLKNGKIVDPKNETTVENIPDSAVKNNRN